MSIKHCLSHTPLRMALVEQECVAEVIELLLEHPHLFTLSEEAALATVRDQLKV